MKKIFYLILFILAGTVVWFMPEIHWINKILGSLICFCSAIVLALTAKK